MTPDSSGPDAPHAADGPAEPSILSDHLGRESDVGHGVNGASAHVDDQPAQWCGLAHEPHQFADQYEDATARLASTFPSNGDWSGSGMHGFPGGGGEQSGEGSDAIYGALDLGTNNCRLLLARPSRRGFRVVDAFSRIIRLGEGVSQTGHLSEPAMNRTMDALKVCASKLEKHRAVRARMVATQACRVASNGQSFIARVRDEFGLDIEVLTPEIEARLAVAGCATLIDPSVDYVVVFDIGGGSSEIVWLDLTRLGERRDQLGGRTDVNDAIVAWDSLPVGVVTLAERFDGRNVTGQSFAAMSSYVSSLLAPFEAQHGFRNLLGNKRMHLLGTSGTVTTMAGVLLGLERYDRKRVDGIWLGVPEINDVTSRLLAMSFDQRVRQPCIGRERADLVLAGCAILDAILKLWPADLLRVADRGLREGILMQLMSEDGVWRTGRRRRGKPRRGN